MAYQSIRKAIVQGRIKPGERMRLGPLAEALGVSQTTVREALNRLAAEHMVEQEPYKGFRARVLSSADVEDLFDLRRALAGLAVEIAADHISDDQLGQMKKLLPQTTLDVEELSQVLSATEDFYWIAFLASGRKHLIQVIKQVVGAVDFDSLTNNMTQQERKNAVKIMRTSNPAFLKSLEHGDGKRARHLIVSYYRDWQQIVQGVMARGID